MDHLIGTWNVRTLNKPGAQVALLNEIQKYNLAITAIQETRWLGKGIRDTRTHTILYSGKPTGTKELGVAFIVDNKIKSNIVDFQPVNERICRLRIQTRFFNLTLINVHGPTEEQEEETKETFYQQLEATYDAIPRNDIKMIIGDMNAKIGKEEEYLGTIGRHSLHEETNENGEFLVGFAAGKNMVISSTCFPHRNIHKTTWMSPDGFTCNQIDHLIIDKRSATCILDVRARRGACCGSDHFLVQARFRCRISSQTQQKSHTQEKLNIEKLKTPEVQIKLKDEIDKKLEEQYGNDSIDNKWNTIKTVVVDTANEVLGVGNRPKTESWFDNDCREAIGQRNEAHRKYIARRTRDREESFREARRRADKICRQKKRKYEDNQILDMEKEFNENNTRNAYRFVKQLRQEYKPHTTLFRDPTGRIVSGTEEIKNIWKDYFQNLLNTEQGNEIENNQQNRQEEEVPVEPPSIDEVQNAIAALNNGKAPGIDDIPSEIWKVGSENLVKSIHNLLERIWEEESIPSEWNKSIICPIYKKGDKLSCPNYRGISLLCTCYKVFTYILNQRLKPYADNILGEYQAGFRKGRSTIDQIFTVKQILRNAWEYDIDVYNIFVDFRQAYDSINREKLYIILKEFNIPPKLTRLIQATLTSTEACVRIQNQLTETFQITQGLKQGDGLAPTLFNLALEYIVRKINVGGSNVLTNKTVQLVAYADDINIMSRALRAAEVTYVELKEAAITVGLKVNTEKTKVMLQTRSNNTIQNATEDDIEAVTQFVYLGAEVSRQGTEDGEIRRRIILANRAYFALSHIFKSKTTHRNIKIRIYKTIVRPIVSYGSEAWTLTQKLSNNINIFERKILRRILGPVKEGSLWRIRYNYELYHYFKDPPLSDYIRIQRLQWAGHVARMGEERIPKRLINRRMQGARPRGRPRMRWEDAVDGDAKEMLRSRNWKREARDREEWRRKLREARARKRAVVP